MELVYGTYNPAKYNSMVNMLMDLDITLISLGSLGDKLIESDESYNNPLGNIKEKAIN